MKKYKLIVFIFLLISSIGYAQLNYEGTIDSKFKTFQLENGQTKYLKYNKEEQKVYIYNLDNTLWKTVKLPLPKNHVLDEIKLISQKTFNTDSLIEIVYSCVVYTPSSNYENPDNPYINIEFTLNIINELGDQLLKVKDSNDMEIVGSKGNKTLLVYKHIGKGFNAHNQTLIYKLP